MKWKAKKIVAMLLVTCVAFLLLGFVAFAGAEAVTADSTVGSVIDWGTLVTQIVVWIIGAVAAIAAWALKKYLYPWFLKVVVPWLKTHNLVTLAEMAVKYAEAELGRYAGEEKWKLAIALMQGKGYDINSDEVTAALKAAWETLDLQQISAGVKDVATEKLRNV